MMLRLKSANRNRLIVIIVIIIADEKIYSGAEQSNNIYCKNVT